MDDENGYIIVDVVIFLLVRQLIDELQVFIDVIIECVVYNMLLSVCCFCDDEIWISSCDSILRFYSLRGELLKLINISLCFFLCGIMLIGCGDVIYFDLFSRMLNIVKDI